MKRLAFVSLLFCLSCHTAKPETGTRAAQQRAAETRIAWIADSIPIVRFDPPFVYHMLKAQVESCSGVHKDGFPAFFIAPIAPLGTHYEVAVFIRSSNVVVFSLGAENQPWVARHELLHWLLAPRDTKDHPPEFFSKDPLIGRCAPFITPEG
jgi:hypothetical protein